MEAQTKKITLLLVFLLLLAGKAYSQKWEQVNDFEITRRMGAIAFSWEGRGYVGFGHDHNPAYPFNDIDYYDAATGRWEEATYLDSGFRSCPFAFVLQDALYIGGGSADSGKTALQDFYRYDLRAGKWQQLRPLPFAYAVGARPVVIKGEAYLAGGCSIYGCEERLWHYNQAQDRWEAGKALPVQSIFPIAFALNNELYFGLGNGARQLTYARIWKTSPADTSGWTQVSSFTSEGRTMCIGIAIDSIHAVAGLGFKMAEFMSQPPSPLFNGVPMRPPVPESNFMMNDFWLYNARTNKWKRLPRQQRGRRGAIAFIADHYLYVGMGNAENKTTKDVYRLDLNKIRK